MGKRRLGEVVNENEAVRSLKRRTKARAGRKEGIWINAGRKCESKKENERKKK